MLLCQQSGRKECCQWKWYLLLSFPHCLHYTISSWIFSGLMKGDEIMVINGAIVSDLDMMFIESVLQEELTLCMMLRSSRPGSRP